MITDVIGAIMMNVELESSSMHDPTIIMSCDILGSFRSLDAFGMVWILCIMMYYSINGPSILNNGGVIDVRHSQVEKWISWASDWWKAWIITWMNFFRIDLDVDKTIVVANIQGCVLNLVFLSSFDLCGIFLGLILSSSFDLCDIFLGLIWVVSSSLEDLWR